MDYSEEGILIIGGDFNIRKGNEGKAIDTVNGERETRVRVGKDTVIGNGGNKMLEFIGKKGWAIANGNMESDKEGEFTFLGARGSTVIDYVIINERAKVNASKFTVEERIESDLHLLV